MSIAITLLIVMSDCAEIPESGEKVLLRVFKQNASELQPAEIVDTYLDNNRRVKFMLRLADSSLSENFRSRIFTERYERLEVLSLCRLLKLRLEARSQIHIMG